MCLNCIQYLVVFSINLDYTEIKENVVKTGSESRLMNELCLNWYESTSEELLFKLLEDSPFYHILRPLSIMTIKHRSVLFQKILEECYNEQKKRILGLITQQQFIDEVWKDCINKCYTLLASCVDGSAIVHELDELFKSKQFGYVIGKDEIELNLKFLCDSLKLSFPGKPPSVPSNDKWAVDVSNKINSFRFSKKCRKIANDLLTLKNYLHDEDQYKILEDLSKEEVCMQSPFIFCLRYFIFNRKSKIIN